MWTCIKLSTLEKYKVQNKKPGRLPVFFYVLSFEGKKGILLEEGVWGLCEAGQSGQKHLPLINPGFLSGQGTLCALFSTWEGNC